MADLEEKLIKLHEDLEKKDKELDTALAKISAYELEKVKNKEDKWKWIKNPAMLTALTGLLAGTGVTYENIMNRLDRESTKERKELVNVKTEAATFTFLKDRQDEVEETCLLYAEAIIEALPTYQQKKIESALEEFGISHDKNTETISRDTDISTGGRGGGSSSRNANISSVYSGVTSVEIDSETEEAEEVMEEAISTKFEIKEDPIEEIIEQTISGDEPNPQNIYMAIKEQAELKGSVDVSKLKELDNILKSQKRRGRKSR